MPEYMCNQKLQKNQQGIVSIVVTVILMIVITLIVLSFAQISRREERNALDRQLSTQAFYAAESGVNDATKVINSWLASSIPSERAKLDSDYVNTCGATGVGYAGSFAAATGITLPVTLTGSGEASYTCMFVDPSPTSIVYTKSEQQHVLPIKDKSGVAINPIEVYWDGGPGSSGFGSCPTPPANPTNWPLSGCDAPILRVELVDATALTTSKVFFIYPSLLAGGTIGFGSPSGSAARADCNTATPSNPNRCKIQITGLLGSASGYYMRVKSIYGSAAITITANSGVAELVGAQALIDVTGKAHDVERRIQVRTQANNLTGSVPAFGLEGTDKICKQFGIDGTLAIDSGPCWAGGIPD